MEDTRILNVTPDVQWVGILDPDLATFDVVMETKYGTTYNSYFINAEKKAVVETCKEKYWDTYLAKLQQVCNPADIEYIIINHTEPDHTGNVANLLKVAPKATVVASGNAIRYLKDLIGYDFPHLIVKDGQELSLGNKTLSFIGAPNLHWPDSIYTYLNEDKLLFTCDSFGAHFCHPDMFDELVGDYSDAFKYYYDVILKPFSKFLLKAIEKIKPLDIAAICTGHGPILRKHWKEIVELSARYSEDYLKMPQRRRILVAYVSAYDKTGKVAEKIAEGVRTTADADVDVCNIELMPLGELDEKLTHSSAYIIGSPTINQNTLLPVYKMFALINPIRDRAKLAAVFGSYGWSGEAATIIEANLKSLKLKVLDEKFTFKFTPHPTILEQAYNYGKSFGEIFSKEPVKEQE